MDDVQRKLEEADKLINEAAAMRDLQRTYYRTYDKGDLNKAKIQEKKWDEMLTAYRSKNPKVNQPKLF